MPVINPMSRTSRKPIPTPWQHRVKPYMEKLINGAITICCFTCIAKDFEDQKARLEVESENFKHYIDVATSRGEDVHPNALFWEQAVEELIQEDTKPKQKCFFGFCCHWKWQYRRGKELANKKEQIKTLIEYGEKINNLIETENKPANRLPVHPPDVDCYSSEDLAIGLPARLLDVERYTSQYYIPFKSRETKYNELLDALNNDNNYIVGLQGMSGIGKTTLVKEVIKKLKQSKQFTQIVNTTVPVSLDIKKIQDDIAGPLGLKFDNGSKLGRVIKLRSRLTNGEKILLILDDVCGDIDFNEIGIPYSDIHKGCRILVTTSNLLVCKKLGCNKTVQLDLLSEEEAWIMFKRYTGLISKVSTKDLLDKGRKIVNECKRLPIAIAVIASSLKGVLRREEWDVALNSMQDVDDEMVKNNKCFSFSYDHLRNEKAKGLFLLCSVFRENEEIPIERITRLSIGVGLSGEDYGSYEDARNHVTVSKDILVDSCLLLEAGQSRVKMHALVRDAAQWLSKKQIQTINLYDKNQKAMVEREKNIKYLLFQGKLKDVFSCKLDGSKLEILIGIVDKDEDYQNMKIEVPNSFFDHNTGLRVFHLFYNHYSKIPLSLPQSIQSLKNIRSILFTLVDLGDISILENLQSLETLDLKDCKIDELPHGIAKLENFTLLNLEGCEIERNNPFEVIERCSSLEELYFTGSFNAFCREITFSKLQRFCIDEYLRVGNDSSSKYVSVVDDDEVFLSETTLKYCMQKADVLRLRRIERGWRNLIPEIVSMDQGMINIVELSLSCISQLQYLIDTEHTNFQEANVLSNLVVLELDRMENLEKLFNGPISLDSLMYLEKLSIKDCKNLQSLFNCKLNLCNLKTIKVQNCPMLVSMFQPFTYQSLVLLEELQIANCKRLENIISDERREEKPGEEIDDSGNNIKCPSSMFPELKVLDIEGCPLLESIFPFLVVQDLPVLQTIKIRRCDGLKYIFGQYTHVEFGSLRQLELFQLPKFIDMFWKSNHPIFLSEKGSSSTSKAQLQLDPMKCNIFSWDTTTFAGIPLVGGHYSESNSYCLNIWERAQCLQIPTKILCNIKKIELSHFSKLKSVFIPSIASKMLLETLTIRNCDELKNIIDFGDYDSDSNKWGTVFPKMKELYIESCPKMEYIFGHNINDHQNHVEVQLQLLELKCLGLYNLSSLVAMCPKHYRIIFPPLEILGHNKCSEAAIKSMSRFKRRSSKKEDGDVQTVAASPPISITKALTTQDVDVKNRQEISKTNNDQGDSPQIDEKLGDGDDQIAMTSFSIATTETNDQVSRNDDAFKKESSDIEEQYDDIM